MVCEGAGDSLMAVAWSGAGAHSAGAEPPLLALSSTSGMVYLGELSAAGGLVLRASWQAHELEGWAVAFSPHDARTLFTGADDAILKRWDLRMDPDAGGSNDESGGGDGGGGGGSAAVTVASNRRAHGAGVCCVAPSPVHEHIIATGSYDEKARLWDARSLRMPLGEVGCDGGVWRLRWHPQRSELLLAACMHAGFAVLRADAPSDAADAASPTALERVSTYCEHGTDSSLGYGADWAYRGAGTPADAPLVGATCSFYDQQCHLWTADL